MAGGNGPRANLSPNPADDPALRRALIRQVDRLAATITYRTRHGSPSGGPPLEPSGYAAQQYREQIAAAWLFMSCVAVWAEDHGLVTPLLRRDPSRASWPASTESRSTR